MQKIQHPTNNDVLGAPAGWDQSIVSCDALPITRADWEGMPAVVSYWRPSAEELRILIEGGIVALWVLGNTMPPVSLDVVPE